jgi:hypothetical protein
MEGKFDERVLERFDVKRDWLMHEIEPLFRPHVARSVAAFDVHEGFADARYDATYGPQPIPAGKDAPTAAAARRAQGAWTGKVWSAAFREHGRADAKWRAPALELLAGYGDFVGTDDQDAATRFRDRAQAVLDAGCDDPLVLYVAARAHERAHGGDRAPALLERAAAGLAGRGYGELFAFFVDRRREATARARGDAAAADALLPAIRRHAVAMAHDPAFAGADARFYVTNVVPEGELGWGCGPLQDGDAQQIAADAQADPWLREMVPGLRHAAAASRCAIEPLPRERREAYFAHVRAAVEHLVAAHGMRPRFPEAAAAMIVVAALEPTDKTPRFWFDQAVATQCDHGPSYDNFLWTLRPDFAGSTAAMYRFGVECLATARFDTQIPLTWLRAVEAIAPLLDNWRWAWSSPDAAARYEMLAAGVIAARPGAPVAEYLRGGRTMTAWAGGRYDDAVKTWSEAGHHLDAQWLKEMNVEQKDVDADLRSAVGAAK